MRAAERRGGPASGGPPVRHGPQLHEFSGFARGPHGNRSPARVVSAGAIISALIFGWLIFFTILALWINI